MAEYIDRESIRKAIQSVTNDPNCPLFIAAMIEQYIDEEPSADVAPVKHGKWIMRGGYFRCSECGKKALLIDIGGTGGFSHEYEQVKSDYCPNCGAKMDGE